MSSESERQLSLEELKQLNRPVEQPPIVPMPEPHPSAEEWNGLSVTENLNTLADEDDLIIGVRGLMNDYYAKDIGKKIRAGYRQKQKDGLVITPPFGYWKDRNTNQVKINPEAAVTVQIIYSLYLQGCGQKEIARSLNAMERKTPAQFRAEQCGREFHAAHKARDDRFLWTYVSVKNVLVEEAYTGVLVNHHTETNSGKVKRLTHDKWYRHENFFPVIIEREKWEQVQELLKRQSHPANDNKAICGNSDLQGVRQSICSDDPLLEWQQSCGICLSWLSSERQELLRFPLHP